MSSVHRFAGLVALLSATVAWSQAAPHSGHAPAPPPAKASAGKSSPAAESRPRAAADGSAAAPAYRSAFEGYRPFDVNEPPRDWRAANEEVRAAGGHVGLMKAAAEAKKGGAK